jgi:hypothetical protein
MIKLSATRTAMISTVKWMARIVAVIVFSAQLVANAHFHHDDPTRRIGSRPVVVVDDGLCALCLLIFHAPFNPVATPMVARPEASAPPLVLPSARAPFSIPCAVFRTRAPPSRPV